MLHTKFITKFFLVSLFILSLIFEINAQEKVVTGFVTTQETIPLIGVKVLVKSSNIETLTDSTGKFTITCNPQDKLKVSADGFFNQRFKIKENTKYVAVNLKLKPGERNNSNSYLNEKDKLNDAGINNGDIDFSGYISLADAINEKVTGVKITTNGNVLITGQGRINGNTSALILVDGIIMDSSILAQLLPSKVKSVDVVKDISGKAAYGFRGGSGVLLIETKSGLD